jgi:ubiquinone/menaquinone biosynthesis C-methylase UbiE
LTGTQRCSRWRGVGAQELPFEDAAFDLVASSFVIDLLDRRRAFREVRRVLRQGGAFGAVAWLPAGTDFAPRRIIVDALADVTPPP